MEHLQPTAANYAGQHPAGRSVFIEQAMLMLGVSKRTVYYRIRDGRLRTIRVRGGSQRVLIDSIRDLVATDRPRAASAPTPTGDAAAASSPSVSCR